MTNRQLLMAALLAASSLGATSAVAQTASPGSNNIVVFLTICISYANNCFTL